MYGQIASRRYVTDKVLAQISIIPNLDDQPMRTRAARMVEDMMSQLEAGVKRVPGWIQKAIKQFDKDLSLRWDFEQGCFVLDIFAHIFGCYMTICSLGPEFTCDLPNLNLLLAKLRAGDMRRAESPEKYLEQKRKQADDVIRVNDVAATERVLGAVQNLTDRSVKEFIEVERALRVGETVFSTGDDAKEITQLQKAAQSAPAPPADNLGLNPHPNKQKRYRKEIA